jgi:hypothetical protein
MPPLWLKGSVLGATTVAAMTGQGEQATEEYRHLRTGLETA